MPRCHYPVKPHRCMWLPQLEMASAANRRPLPQPPFRATPNISSPNPKNGRRPLACCMQGQPLPTQYESAAGPSKSSDSVAPGWKRLHWSAERRPPASFTYSDKSPEKSVDQNVGSVGKLANRGNLALMHKRADLALRQQSLVGVYNRLALGL